MVWVLLAIWAGALVGGRTLQFPRRPEVVNTLAQLMGTLALIHITMVRHPVGLAAFSAVAVLAVSEASRSKCLLLAVAPVWLAYFSQSNFRELSYGALTQVWPYLTAGAAAYLMATLVRECYGKTTKVAETPLLYQKVLHELSHNGIRISSEFLAFLGVAQL